MTRVHWAKPYHSTIRLHSLWLQTGTLTENRMTVVEGWFAGAKYDTVPQPQDLPGAFFSMFQTNVAVNSSVGANTMHLCVYLKKTAARRVCS